tara:strand:- start:147 stop:359 length:213 start_codon:yes stop_codon:yes gene_type:complete
MGMSTQGEMDKLGEIFHLLIKMGCVVAYQDFKAAIGCSQNFLSKTYLTYRATFKIFLETSFVLASKLQYS